MKSLKNLWVVLFVVCLLLTASDEVSAASKTKTALKTTPKSSTQKQTASKTKAALKAVSKSSVQGQTASKTKTSSKTASKSSTQKQTASKTKTSSKSSKTVHTTSKVSVQKQSVSTTSKASSKAQSSKPASTAAQTKSSVTSAFVSFLKKQSTASKKTSLAVAKAVQQREMDTLKKKIVSYLSANGLSSGEWSVYVKNLKTNQSITTNNRRYTAASTIKLFAMAAAYDKVKKGQLSLSPTLSSLIRSMIVYSDNDSFNSIVCDYVGSDYLNRFIKNQGLKNTAQYHGIGPGSHPYIEQSKGGPINYTNAADCGTLLEKIYRGTLVSKSYSQQMLELLKAQTHRWKIPAGIPNGVTVANKTGEYEQLEHDTAIVYGPKTNYIICIFSESSKPGSISHIQSISSLVYHYLND